MRGPVLTLVPAAALAALLAACGQNAAPDDAPAPPPEIVRVEPAAQALAGAHVRTLDPATMNDAEVMKVVGPRPHCTFRYTGSGKPVLVAGLDAGGSPELGVVKLNGKLLSLQPDRAATGLKPGGFVLAADPVRLRVQPDRPVKPGQAGERTEAELLFEVGQELKVGYGGYFECGPGAPGPAALRQ